MPNPFMPNWYRERIAAQTDRKSDYSPTVPDKPWWAWPVPQDVWANAYSDWYGGAGTPVDDWVFNRASNPLTDNNNDYGDTDKGIAGGANYGDTNMYARQRTRRMHTKPTNFLFDEGGNRIITDDTSASSGDYTPWYKLPGNEYYDAPWAGYYSTPAPNAMGWPSRWSQNETYNMQRVNPNRYYDLLRAGQVVGAMDATGRAGGTRAIQNRWNKSWFGRNYGPIKAQWSPYVPPYVPPEEPPEEPPQEPPQGVPSDGDDGTPGAATNGNWAQAMVNWRP